jgi:tRNA modification GTPase
MHDLDATLVVVGTPPGRGGIGCVRLSGAQAERIGRSLFLPNRDPIASETRAPVFGRLLDRYGRPIDHGFLIVFPAGRAYTGEPSVELWSHGSPAVLAELVDSAMSYGARPAGPGEFTYRAWRNGRLDLSQAEAIRDLIDARTAYQARIAFSQAEGALSRRLTPLRSTLEEWLVRGEAAVEFVDEPETAVPLRQLTEALELAQRECRDLLSSFDAGRIVRTGAVAAIIGRPNVGKSSIFNRLLGRERSIVTPTPGTTRDTVEEEIDLAGIPARIIDTAGLRRTDDPVESEGLRRAEVARREADVVLLVLDGSCPLDDAERRALEEASGPRARTLVVRSKSDLPQDRWQASVVAPISVSARTGEGMAVLRAALLERIRGTGTLEDPILTNARHAEAIRAADAALSGALDGFRSGVPEDLVLEDVKLALRHLAGITGEFTTEQLLDRIFSTFCIGK